MRSRAYAPLLCAATVFACAVTKLKQDRHGSRAEGRRGSFQDIVPIYEEKEVAEEHFKMSHLLRELGSDAGQDDGSAVGSAYGGGGGEKPPPASTSGYQTMSSMESIIANTSVAGGDTAAGPGSTYAGFGGTSPGFSFCST